MGGSAPVAVVTGASRGLGRRLCEVFLERGFRVAAGSRASRLEGLDRVSYRPLDLRRTESVDRFVREMVEELGRVDVLVNNAGYASPPQSFAEVPDEVLEESFATNVVGPAALLRRVLPVMTTQAEGGVVLNVASRAALTPVPGLAAYSASKSALVSLTLATAKELRDSRVLLVAVCPAGMNTEMRAAVYGRDDAQRQMDVERTVGVMMEIATSRTVEGSSIPSGAAVLVLPEGPARVQTWSADDRGHRTLAFE
jgi:NAD(P)-dependent dehydrogenase (short-subunit alcohol dehydrogenase family)